MATIRISAPPTPSQEPSHATTETTPPPDEPPSDSFSDAKTPYDPLDARHQASPPLPPASPSQPGVRPRLTAQALAMHQRQIMLQQHQMTLAFNNPKTLSTMDSLDVPEVVVYHYLHVVPSDVRKWGLLKAHLRANGMQLDEKFAYAQWRQHLEFQAQCRAQSVERRRMPQRLSRRMPCDGNDVRDGYWTEDELGRLQFNAWGGMWWRPSTASDCVEETPPGAFVVDEEAAREWEFLLERMKRVARRWPVCLVRSGYEYGHGWYSAVEEEGWERGPGGWLYRRGGGEVVNDGLGRV